jgi:hypothetical protein
VTLAAAAAPDLPGALARAEALLAASAETRALAAALLSDNPPPPR